MVGCGPSGDTSDSSSNKNKGNGDMDLLVWEIKIK